MSESSCATESAAPNIVYSNHSSDVSMTSMTSPRQQQPPKKNSRFTSVLVPESPRKSGLFNSFKMKNKKDVLQSHSTSDGGPVACEPSSSVQSQQSLGPNVQQEPSRRFSQFLDHFRPRAKSDSRSKKLSLQHHTRGTEPRVNLSPAAAFLAEKQRNKMAADMISVYATIHGGQRPPMTTIPSVEEENVARMELDLPPLYVDTSLANRQSANAGRAAQSLSGRGQHVARWPLQHQDRKRCLSSSTEAEPRHWPRHKTSSPYTRSTSTKASPIAQQSLDSSNADERSSKRLIIFKESALASGVKLMQAANLENKELLFYHLLKVNNAFNILPNSSKVVVFDVRLPVKKAFYALVYNSVRAATLVDSEQRFVGMLTITDFIQILHHYEAQGKDYIKELEHNRICDWKTVQAEQKLAHPFLFIYAEQSLFTAVDILIRNAIHRLPIIDSKTHNILYILTLKRLLKYLYLYSLDLRPAFLSKTPKELDVGTFDNVVTVTHRTPLREAMRKFMDHRVSSLPVVDQDLIVQDIYCKFDVINLLANNSYENLNISVREALQQRWVSRQRDDMRLRTNFFEDVIKCSPTDCLWKVIETLVFHQIHRVMIVDEEQHLCGLVSLSDIFKFFIIPRVEVSNVIPSWTSDMIDADMADNAPPTVGPFRSRSRDDE